MMEAAVGPHSAPTPWRGGGRFDGGRGAGNAPQAAYNGFRMSTMRAPAPRRGMLDVGRRIDGRGM